VRVLVTGWFSFDEAEITAGDLLARDTAVRWLAESGLPHDVAVAGNFRRDGDLGLADTDPDAYSDVLFVCGPAAGKLVTEMFGRFPHARRLALGVSAVDGTAQLGLDALLERDSDAAVRPDLSLAAPATTAAARLPVIGVVLVHDQPEYGDRHRLSDAHALLGAALSRVDAIATTRMHGMALALKAGVPAVAVDPVTGGGKVSAQARALGWPGLARVGETSPGELAGVLRWSLSAEARAMAAAVAAHAEPALGRLRADFLALFPPPAV
jgi:hypothetical protein